MHLAGSHRWTGVAEPATSLALYQEKSGIARAWLACTPGHSFQRKARERGVEVLDQFHFNRNYNPYHIWLDIKHLIRFVREKRVNVVHCHLPQDHWLSAFALRVFKMTGCLVVRTVHRFAPPRPDPFHRWLFKKATDLIITPTKALAELLSSHLKLNPERLRVVYGAVDTNRFHPGIDKKLIREKFGIPVNVPVAGLVARLRKDRGIYWLMESIPLVLRKIPDAYFVIVGRGELKYWLKDFIKKSPYGKHILRTGYRSNDLPETYAAFDCSLFLGLGSEGSCRAVLEAMASGKPVIALNDGGLKEVITPGENGLLVSPQNRRELAEAIINLFSSTERREKMGITARQTIERRFTEERRATETLALYLDALNKKYPHSC